MGAGKTTAARALGLPAADSDDLVEAAARKPIAEIFRDEGEAADALVERSDVSAVEALAIVAEAAVAWELARAAREKFGGDSLGDFVGAWRAYLERIDWTPR